uniref:Uncharacterized protein n=1 Tax=Peronospora matthiolae TaxID=2874970 RepID=A0AAV1UN05_9STRA
MNDEILSALVGVMDRLANFESSQRVRDEDESILGSVENGMSASALSAKLRGRQNIVKALGSPEQKPAFTLDRALAPGDGVSMFASLAPPRG